ncbi:MAG: hypothetical protein ACRD19_01850 [Terriglobia bacterium]
MELAREIFGKLQKKGALIIGAGKMSKLAARHLLRKGAAGLLITNRSRARAEQVASVVGGEVVPYDLPQSLTRADLELSGLLKAASDHFRDQSRLADSMVTEGQMLADRLANGVRPKYSDGGVGGFQISKMRSITSSRDGVTVRVSLWAAPSCAQAFR